MEIMVRIRLLVTLILEASLCFKTSSSQNIWGIRRNRYQVRIHARQRPTWQHPPVCSVCAQQYIYIYIYIYRERERHLKISLLTLFCLFVTPFVAAGVRADGETRAIETDTLTRLVRIYLSFTKHWRNETSLCLVVFFPFFKKREVDGVALCSLFVLRWHESFNCFL